MLNRLWFSNVSDLIYFVSFAFLKKCFKFVSYLFFPLRYGWVLKRDLLSNKIITDYFDRIKVFNYNVMCKCTYKQKIHGNMHVLVKKIAKFPPKLRTRKCLISNFAKLYMYRVSIDKIRYVSFLSVGLHIFMFWPLI